MAADKSYRKGWRNNYRHAMPWTEVVMKDLSGFARDFKNQITRGKKKPIVAFPDYPSKKTTLLKIAGFLGHRLSNKPLKEPAVVLYFEDITHGSNVDVKRLYPHMHILNVNCTDISKVKVDAVHQEVFGYNTFIDPERYVGKAVMKSDTNALHDGRIIDCPTTRVAGSVCQVLIDNTWNDEFVMDLRVAVVGKKIVHAYKKFKKYAVRFTNEVSYSELHETASLFTEEEQEKILDFCSHMGLDFGELDILRNNSDNRIYIIDVNKTPYGPPFGLTPEHAVKAVENLSENFDAAFLK